MTDSHKDALCIQKLSGSSLYIFDAGACDGLPEAGARGRINHSRQCSLTHPRARPIEVPPRAVVLGFEVVKVCYPVDDGHVV